MQVAAPTSAIVYRARNLVNGHSYIGFTTKGLVKRESQHRRDGRLGYLRCARFSRALKKYGDENFVFEVMYDFNGDEDFAKLYEIEAIEKYRPEYNLSRGGDGGSLAEETKQRISAGNLGKSRNAGVKKSTETRSRMSAAMTGVKHVKTDKLLTSVLANLHKAREACKIPVICLDDGRIFPGAVDAEKFYGLPKGKVCLVTTGQRKHTKGMHFARYETPK